MSNSFGWLKFLRLFTLMILSGITIALININNAGALENKVKIGGFYDFRSAYYKNNGKSEQKIISTYNKTFGLLTSGVVFIEYNLIDNNENLYGAKISLEHTTINDKSVPFYIYSESLYGRIEAGADATAGKKMRITGYTASTAVGNGWSSIVMLSPYAAGSKKKITAYIINFGSFFDEKNRVSGKSDYARKISYFTPKLPIAQGHKIQFGVSYIADSANMGHDNVNKDNKTSPVALIPYKFTVRDGVSYGVVYSGRISDEVTMKLSYVGEVGKVVAFEENPNKSQRGHIISNVPFKNLNTYVIGGELIYNNISISAAYTNYNKSLTAKFVDKISRNSYAYGAGIKYKLGRYAFSINQFNSSFKKNELSMTTLGSECLVARGLKAYIQTGLYYVKGKYLDAKSIIKTDKSKGMLIFLGAKVSF